MKKCLLSFLRKRMFKSCKKKDKNRFLVRGWFLKRHSRLAPMISGAPNENIVQNH